MQENISGCFFLNTVGLYHWNHWYIHRVPEKSKLDVWQ